MVRQWRHKTPFVHCHPLERIQNLWVERREHKYNTKKRAANLLLAFFCSAFAFYYGNITELAWPWVELFSLVFSLCREQAESMRWTMWVVFFSLPFFSNSFFLFRFILLSRFQCFYVDVVFFSSFFLPQFFVFDFNENNLLFCAHFTQRLLVVFFFLLSSCLVIPITLVSSASLVVMPVWHRQNSRLMSVKPLKWIRLKDKWDRWWDRMTKKAEECS